MYLSFHETHIKLGSKFFTQFFFIDYTKVFIYLCAHRKEKNLKCILYARGFHKLLHSFFSIFFLFRSKLIRSFPAIILYHGSMSKQFAKRYTKCEVHVVCVQKIGLHFVNSIRSRRGALLCSRRHDIAQRKKTIAEQQLNFGEPNKKVPAQQHHNQIRREAPHRVLRYAVL